MPTRSQRHLREFQGYDSGGGFDPGGAIIPVPVLTTLTPNTASIAAGPFPVAVFGSNFHPTAVVVADGVTMPTNYFGPEDLGVAAMTPSGLPRTIVVEVHQGSNVSNPLNFTLTA